MKARLPFASRSTSSFTLVEMLVAMAVLGLLMVMIGQLTSMALAVTLMRTKQMDADTQARAVFGRMAIDLAQLVKRPDVDYYLKCSMSDTYGNPSNPQTGNDQLAFYSQVPGYYPSSTAVQQSQVSLVGWRVNADNTPGPYYNQLQRFGYGLLWNGASSFNTNSVLFSIGTNDLTTAPAAGSSSTNQISNWPESIDPKLASVNYEVVGPAVFRMEYYYVLKGQTAAGTTYASELSDNPWDVRITGHNSVNGLQDVAAITVVIAVADPQSRLLVNNSQLTTLAGKMEDFPTTPSTGVNTTKPGDVAAAWTAEILAATADPSISLAKVAVPSLRVYQRTFYLPSYPPSN